MKDECCAFHQAYALSSVVLGQGAHAVVKLATRTHGDTIVGNAAVKILTTRGDEELCRAARAEYELLRSCTHPNIGAVYDFYSSPASMKAYLCMELLTGATLRATVEEAGVMRESYAQTLFGQLALALAHIHGLRIVHRDVKPDNIMVTIDSDSQSLRLCDFGCARRLVEGDLLSPRTGTVSFAAPELLLGQCTKGEPLDVWGAGLCLFFALSGGATLQDFDRQASADPVALGTFLAGTSTAERSAWVERAGLAPESSAAAMLRGCVDPDPTQRLDATQLLGHPWLASTVPCCHVTPSTVAKVAAIRAQIECSTSGSLPDFVACSDEEDSELGE